MLTAEERASLEAMPREDLAKLLAIIREALAMYRVGGAMPQSAIEDLVKAVPNKLCSEIVNDLRGGRAQPGWLPPSEVGRPREPVPAKEVPLEGRRDIRWIDQMVDVQDAIDKAERAKGFGSAGLGGPRVMTKDDPK